MQITVNRAELAAAVTYVKRALPRRPAVPILAGIRVEVADGQLSLAAFDYEMTARALVAGDDAQPGVVLVTGAMLADAVKVLPKGSTVRAGLSGTSGNGLVIRCEGTVTELGALALDEYPQLPAMPSASGTVAAEDFRRTVTRVSAAAGTDDTLPSLTCLSMVTGESAITVSATDRYRLAVDEMSWTPADLDAPARQYLIPAKAIADFAKKCAGKVTMHFGEGADCDTSGHGFGGNTGGFAALADGTRELIIRTSAGSFPKHASLIRSASTTTVTVDAASLAAAVTAAGAMCERSSALQVDVRTDAVVAEAIRDGCVTARRSVPADRTGDDVRTGFSPAYLASMLAGVDGTASLAFDGPKKPVQITAGNGDPFTALVMPIRLNG